MLATLLVPTKEPSRGIGGRKYGQLFSWRTAQWDDVGGTLFTSDFKVLAATWGFDVQTIHLPEPSNLTRIREVCYATCHGHTLLLDLYSARTRVVKMDMPVNVPVDDPNADTEW
jgi:hypothetical protein